MEFKNKRRYTGPVKAVILDWAGTTVDYGCYAPAVVFIDTYKMRGIEISMAQAREPMGVYKRDHIRQISRIPAVARKWEEVHGTVCTEADVDSMFADFIPRQIAVLARYADLIPGTLQAVEKFRNRGLKIGSTTGYTGEMMKLLLGEAKKRGYEPDSTVCATDVSCGRPAPWMCFRNAENLGIYPPEACVKIGDTLPDVEEGLNAGMWTIGLAKTGNEIGSNEKEIEAMDPAVFEHKIRRARKRMAMAGAHYVVDGIWDCDPLIDEINKRLKRGEKP